MCLTLPCCLLPHPRVLCCCQVPLPPEGLNTHHTFEWNAAEVLVYRFCVPKPKKPKKRKKAKGSQEGDGGETGGDDAQHGKAEENAAADNGQVRTSAHPGSVRGTCLRGI